MSSRVIFFDQIKPRRFNYRAQFYKPEEEPHRIRFRRISYLDYRQSVNRPIIYLLVVLIIIVYIIMTGGIRGKMDPISLKKNDVINVATDSSLK